MKTHPRSLSRARLAGACCLLATSTLTAPSARAGSYHPTAQEHQDIAKLIGDLQTLKAGSEVTDAEKQALAGDLLLLSTSTTKPSPDSVDQLAADLSSALADGSLSPTEKAQLILDVDGVFNSAGLTTDEASQFISDAQAILASSGIDAVDVQLIASDLAAITADVQRNFISTEVAFTLTAPTTGADAVGRAQLLSTVNADGTGKDHLSLETVGLITGTYTVSATTLTNATPVSFGSLRVIGRKNRAGIGSVLFGDSKNAFPAGFDAAAIATVTVTNTSGAVVISGAVSDASKMIRAGHFRLVAGAAYPEATGQVDFVVDTTKKKLKKHFLLFGRKLPASATLTLKVNGTPAGQVTTGPKGRLLISTGSVVLPVKKDGFEPLLTPIALPGGVDLTTLETLELDDAQGQVVVTAGFVEATSL